jgi:hypothetical protein
MSYGIVQLWHMTWVTIFLILLLRITLNCQDEVSEVHLGVMEIIGRVLLYLCIGVIAMWFGYMFSMAIINTVCDCIRTGPGDFWIWLQKEGA